MKKKTKDRINKLAKLFYKIRGYQAEDGYDFSKATHPDEITCWR